MKIFGKNGNIGSTLKGTEDKLSLFLSYGDLNLLFYWLKNVAFKDLSSSLNFTFRIYPCIMRARV